MGINVLSLFDGMSCGQIALGRVGIEVENYFASEIDTHSINVSKSNFPQIIHLGDIKDISANLLPKIDLLIGGSPCQDLSNAQNGSGWDRSQTTSTGEPARACQSFVLSNHPYSFFFICHRCSV